MAIPTMKYDTPTIYINGKEVGRITGGFSAHSKPVFKVPEKPLEARFEIKMTDDAKEVLETLMKEFSQYQSDMRKAMNAWIQDCVRTRVVPPIKGEITRGKVKWRGLSLCYGPDGSFLGILQRKHTLYSVDGNTYKTQE